MPDTEIDKSTLRRMLSARRYALTEDDRTEIGEVILSRLMSLPLWKNASVIGGYLSTRGELDMLPLWQAAVAEGKTYALPVTLSGAKEGRMLFRATPSYCPERLVEERFGILEPPADGAFPVLPPEALSGALIVVPALGFDRDGYRIGYGGGYYDRFLDRLAALGVTAYTVGLCPAVCRVEQLPREAHDRAVQVVIDEA